MVSNYKIKNCFVVLFLLFHIVVKAQVAGKGTYAFLNMFPSARSLSLGTNFVSAIDKDLSVGYQNPAALNEKMHNHAFASYNNYVADINTGYFGYARHYKKIGTFSANIFYLDYVKFDGYLPNGLATGSFTVKDQCFQVSYGNAYKEKLRYGANLKYVYSIYEQYVSNGFATDLSAIYTDTAKQLNITAFARNIGFQAISYGETGRQPLAFEMAIAFSKKLKYLPFRYNLVLNNLQKPDMRYEISNTKEKDENGNLKVKKMTLGDNVLRHLALGGEFNLSKHFVVRFGYNHQRRKEISPEQKRGTTGFSWGLGFRISKLNISYGSASLFPGFNSNQFSILCNLGEFYNSKKI